MPMSYQHPGRQQEIDEFIVWCDQEYDDYMGMTPGRAEEIACKYFSPFSALTDEVVSRLLGIMRSSIQANPRHRAIREWKGCCVGVADYLFRPSDLDGEGRGVCARALQRFSGWYHAGIPLWSRFQPTAQQIGNTLYRPNFLRYLKIGEEWTFDPARLDPSLTHEGGWMTLWDVARGVPNSVRTQCKLDEETRTLASRVLNFLCERCYTVHITAEDWQEVVSRFPGGNTLTLPPDEPQRRRHPLLRWSVDSEFIDLITQRLIVNGPQLLPFLQQSGFNPDVTYNPDGDERLPWFHTWDVLHPPPP